MAGEVKTSPGDFTPEQIAHDIATSASIGADVHLMAAEQVENLPRLNASSTAWNSSCSTAPVCRPPRISRSRRLDRENTTNPATGEELPAPCDRVWDALVTARAGYLAGVSPHYDEVFQEVAQRAQLTGSLGKMDIAALVVWKRLSAQTPWVSALMSLSDIDVRSVTERAVAAVRETAPRGEAARTGRAIMWELPGFRTGDALASAVLTAAAPARMAVYDRRVQHALNRLGLALTSAPGRYGRYMQLLDDLLRHGGARAAGWTARDIDTALYWAGGNPDQAPPSRSA
ncbi:hypothetical protein ACFYXJ_07835 [Streptomyces sp. NPDC002667]|uniref:hypothetical protein n=1 Tax=Streptomyces sp. NPDC002667 TaxID=3364657 RepID=UPI003689E004